MDAKVRKQLKETVSDQRLLNLYQQQPLTCVANGVEEANEAEAGPESVEPDTGPRCQVIGAYLIVLDLEPNSNIACQLRESLPSRRRESDRSEP